MLANAPISFKVGLQGLAAQFTMEAELVAAALTMKEAAFCSNMMLELGFDESFVECRCTLTTRQRCTSPVTASTVLAQNTSR